MATKDFGVPIDLSNGIFTNTLLTDNGITLIKEASTYDGLKDVYATTGVFLSDVIDLNDKYTELGNLAMNFTLPNSDTTYKAYTRVSDNNLEWSDFAEIDYATGKMNSDAKRYIQIKIELNSNAVDYDEIAITFTPDDISRLTNTDYITTENNILELKRNYNFKMEKINEQNMFKTTILSSKFKKIDKIRLEVN